MGEGRHTPGPWSIQYGVTNDPEKYAPGIDSEEGDFSILMWGEKQHEEGGIRGRTTEEQQANARLIAAAPDLLKACRQALVALKGREHDQFLRDVIAKATWGAA